MLMLVLSPGEYFTIGEDIVIQYNNLRNSSCRLGITAPKELRILRGRVLEQSGEQRPDCVVETPQVYRKDLVWNRSKALCLQNIRRRLAEMPASEDVRFLQTQLDLLFPPAEPETAARPQ